MKKKEEVTLTSAYELLTAASGILEENGIEVEPFRYKVLSNGLKIREGLTLSKGEESRIVMLRGYKDGTKR